MTRRVEDLHGQRVEIVDVDLIEDVDGVPSWIKVEREFATVVIVPSLLVPQRQEADA